MSDPFAGTGLTDRNRPAPDLTFWKPTAPEILIGTLDRIDESKFGDVGVFLTPVVLRAQDFKPLQAPALLRVSFGAKFLADIFHGTDQGKTFRITFTGYNETDRRMREFAVAELSDPVAAQALIDRARVRFAQENPPGAGATSDDLPF